MRTLVTGGAGFLGRHIARHLVSESHEVTIFDRVPANDPDIQTIIGDLTDAASIESAVKGHDSVFHVGAIGDVYLAGEDPALAANVNAVGTANVARAALTHDAGVVYASTWEVYGEPVCEPLGEDHRCEPDHPYSITKLAGERLLLSAAKLGGLPAVALRLGTAYGTGLRTNSVFRIFIDRARRGEPIVIQGDGSQSRQFTHARDIARAFVAAAVSGCRGEVFNVVSEESVTIRELAETVAEALPTQVSFGASRPGDVPPARVSAAKAGDILGWKAEIPFESGLRRLIDDE